MRLLQRALRGKPLVVLACALKCRLGVACSGVGLELLGRSGALVHVELCESRRQRREKRHCRGSVHPHLLDLALEPLDLEQRLRDIGVAALELFGEGQKRFQRAAGWESTP